MANPRSLAKPVTNNRPVVQLSIPQVKKFFPKPWAQALKDHALNIKCMKEDGDFDPKDPGILPPHKCVWTLQRPTGFCPKHPAPKPLYEFPDYPGYELHMYDEEAIASFSGGGSDMVWVGDEWEM
jgi:hypothetical protein